MRIGSINFLLPKIQTASVVADRALQSNPEASYSALLPHQPDVFIKQASHQPQTSSPQTLMQRPNAAKEASPQKQKSEPTSEKPIALTKGGLRQFK